MKRSLLLVTFFILINASLSLETCYINYSMQGDYYFHNIKEVNLTFSIPVRKGVIKEESNGEIDNYLTYHFTKDAEGSYYYRAQIIKNSSFILLNDLKIYNKSYLTFDNQIDFNEELINLSLSLQNKNVIQTLFNSFYWVCKNINYDKSLENVTLSSTQVFSLKKGVCRHYSKLLTSLLRLQGIPAKVVSGYAFSNKFEPHAWIRVFISNKSIDIDPTFCQFIASPNRIELINSSLISVTYSYLQGSNPVINYSSPKVDISSNCYTYNNLNASITYTKKASSNDFIQINISLYNPYNAYLLTYYNLNYLTKEYPLKLIYGKDVDYILVKPKEKEVKTIILKTPEIEGFLLQYNLSLSIQGVNFYIPINVSDKYEKNDIVIVSKNNEKSKSNFNVTIKDKILVSGTGEGTIIFYGNEIERKDVNGSFNLSFPIPIKEEVKVCFVNSEISCKEVEIKKSQLLNKILHQIVSQIFSSFSKFFEVSN